MTLTQDTAQPPTNTGRTRRSTVYLLQDTGTDSAGLREALNSRYERDHGFVVEDVTTGGVRGVLCHGGIGRNRPPDWAAAVDTLTGRKPDVQNRTAACALLLPVDGEVFALTFGMGHLLLEPSRISPGFGFDFVLRAAQPDAIRQVTDGPAGPHARGRPHVAPGVSRCGVLSRRADRSGGLATRAGGLMVAPRGHMRARPCRGHFAPVRPGPSGISSSAIAATTGRDRRSTLDPG